MIRRTLLYPFVAIALVVPAAILLGKDPEPTQDAAKEMLEAAREGYALQVQARQAGESRGPGHQWSERILKAERLLATTADERREAAKRHLERMKNLLEVETKLYESQEVGRLAVVEAQFHVAEAKQLLAEN